MAVSLTAAANATATATSLLSITAPWVQPSDCETQWLTTTTSWTMYGPSVEAQAIILSAPAASCNPPGWDRFGPESRLRFSPGVCPKGWIYHDMAEDGSTGASTAFCCQSGFSNDKAMYYTFYGSRDCVQNAWMTAFDSAASTTTSKYTVMMHEAWAVTWDATDTSTLTPKLPTLTSSMRVPKWTPKRSARANTTRTTVMR
ncbi:hypothetical protein CSOJ01_14020 [Colletotrichum sojae]|uniref:Uncharacterized protein n=1 Tax=Colletotrichum sojae TaxID=2175907 RepID=A0A8H6IQW3_9PEZI|nr:hypothetical protein CSOJ01_14020 [Colletotrichum sojae]